MKRRYFIQLGMAGLAGCGKGGRESTTVLKAGPFAVTVPVNWSKSAIIEKVPLHPLYPPEYWKLYQEDKRNEFKPYYLCRPEHWAIRLPAALPAGHPGTDENVGDDPTAPQILIHKANEWSVAGTDGKHEEMNTAEMIRSMRGKMETAMTHDESDLSPAFTHGSLDFRCLKRRIDFAGGHGIRLVAQRNYETDLMRFGQLHYLFLGMSDDDSCQIIATFPLNLPGLPKPEEKTHLGRSIANYDDLSNNYDQYISDAKKWLEQNADKITPSLRTLDQMLESLVARRWE